MKKYFTFLFITFSIFSSAQDGSFLSPQEIENETSFTYYGQLAVVKILKGYHINLSGYGDLYGVEISCCGEKIYGFISVKKGGGENYEITFLNKRKKEVFCVNVFLDVIAALVK